LKSIDSLVNGKLTYYYILLILIFLGIVNGHTKGLKLIVVKTLTIQERLALGEQLKKSNDKLTQMEEEKMKRLEDRENELEEMLKREKEERLENLTNENQDPQETMSHKIIIVKEIPKQTQITEVDGLEGDSQVMQNDHVTE